MREHLATLLNDFRKSKHEIAIVRYQGVRRRVTTYGELATWPAGSRHCSRIAASAWVIAPAMGRESAEWVAAFYGCMLRGVIAVPLDHSEARNLRRGLRPT